MKSTFHSLFTSEINNLSVEERLQKIGMVFLALALTFGVSLIYGIFSLGALSWTGRTILMADSLLVKEVEAEEDIPVVRVETGQNFSRRAELISPFRWGDRLSAPPDYSRLI